jgi:hypothetical protein
MQITLHPSEGARLASGGAVRIRCLAGVLWITSHHDSKDRLLAAGDSAELAAAPRQYLSSVGRKELVSFEVTGAAASIRVQRSGAFPADAEAQGWRRVLGALAALGGQCVRTGRIGRGGSADRAACSRLPGLGRWAGLGAYLRQFV